MSRTIKVALVGNPNTGKTSIFNLLTGLNQKVGNYPGITVERKLGSFKISEDVKAQVIDLPGTYSMTPSSMDEEVAVKVLKDKNSPDYPDAIVVVTEVENLKRNLFLYTQVKEFQIPTLLVLNMSDKMSSQGISIDIPALEEKLQTKIALVSTRKNTGLDQLKKNLLGYESLPTEKLTLVAEEHHSVVTSPSKHRETIVRYQFINEVLKNTYKKDLNQGKGLQSKLDKILLHKFWGYVIFSLLMILIFQAIFAWSATPMGWIDNAFGMLSEWLNDTLPEGKLTDLIANGIVPGVGGIVIFVPQIAFLFLFISILEESGYMSRVVFLADRTMRRFGLSGKSVVPLVSGMACAIPAVMATRNIENWKERLVTILVTPFVTCAARLPIYLVIVELVIPDGHFLIFSYKGLVFFALYAMGFMVAVIAAWIWDKVLKLGFGKSHFIAEMPSYKLPMLRNVWITVYEKTSSFVIGAGKIILVISIILWFLASHGSGEKYDNSENYISELATQNNWSEKEQANNLEAYQLEHSYLGVMGKTIEPIFRPLGFDWKISVGVISSFAAREVLMGTLASIYSLGGDLDLDDDSSRKSLIQRMRDDTWPDGTPVFTLATGVAILLFYAFAMQCLSTLAVVKKETNSWKWPIFQLASMSSFAYIVAFMAHRLLS